MALIGKIKGRIGLILEDPNIKNNHVVRQEYGLFVGYKLFAKNVSDALTGYRTSFYKKYVAKIIERELSSTVEQYRRTVERTQTFEGKIPVWVLWWQGYDSAPEIVKRCIDSQRLALSDQSYEYHLLTQENIWSFIELPDVIKEKYDSGCITLTHLSDVIRVLLLAKYGGLWIDSTIFMSNDFTDDIRKFKFYTNKKNINSLNQRKMISAGRWTAYFMKSEANDMLFLFMLDAFTEYWRNHYTLLDYWLVDYTINLAYDSIPAIANKIDRVPENNPGIFNLFIHRNELYRAENFEKLVRETILHKQSYKCLYYAKDSDGNLTNWGFISER
ncbi:MAG: capsular polysaccharide synthesis protein [Lachnospiraceae bacterium]